MNEGGFINVTKTGEGIYYTEYTVILNIFKSAYFHIFGELFLEENINDPSTCQSTLGDGSHNKTYNIAQAVVYF